MLKLVVEKGPREGDTHEFPTNAVVKIGRVVRGNTIAFKDDAGISSKHLLIESNPPDKWLISDLNSSNGTTLNVTQLPPLRPTQLSDGDVVKLGEYTSIKVQIVASAGGESPSPPRRRLRARKEDGSGCDLGGKVAAVKPPPGRGRPTRKFRVLPEGEEEEVEKKVGIEVQPVNTRRTTRSSAKALAESSNPEPPKRGGGRRKKQLPEVAEDVVSEYAGDNAGPPPVCENAGENVVPSDMNEHDAGRSNLGLEEHQEGDLEVKNVGIVPPTLPKQGRQTGTRRTRSSSIAGECSTKEGNEYLETEVASQVGGGAKRNKPSSEVVHNVSSEDAGANVEVQNLGSPHASEKARENIEQNGPRETVQASDADKEDVQRSHLGRGENNVDLEQEPDLEKMTLGDWFDYLEVYLPKQIIKETEEIISSMKHKADQVYEYKLKHRNDQGKGKSAMV